MSSFLFSPANSEDLSTGTYYLHLVNSVPNPAHTTANQLTISDAIGYAPAILTGLVYNTLRWTFNDFSFPAYTFNTIPVGVVICKRLSSNIAPSDPVLYYSDLSNVLLQPIVLTTGKYTIGIKFPSSGVIIFSQYYQYDSGAYVNNETLPKGLMWMLGTRNNTQTFLNPLNNSYLVYNDGAAGTNSYFTSRTINNDVSNGNTVVAINFGSRRIRVGTFGIYANASRTVTYTIWGSNTCPDLTPSSVNNSAFWTQIGNNTNLVSGWNFTTSNSNIFWKFFKIVYSVSTAAVDEFEFFNSSMYSTDENLMSTVIDSPFDVNLLDNSGFNHMWNSTGAPVILNNSVRMGFSERLTLSASSLVNLTDRSFKLSISVSIVLFPDSTGRGILNWDGADFPLSVSYINNKLNTAIGTASSWFYLPNAPGEAVNTGFIGIILPNTFYEVTTTKLNNIFTTFVNGTSVYSIPLNNVIGNSSFVTLGSNSSSNMNGSLKNLKLVT
jgi:hypothetical protein